MRRSVTAVAGTALALFAGGSLLHATPSRAETDVSFSGLASAAGTDSTLTNPAALPLGVTVEVAGPVAQASLDSLGVSLGFASAPYPGPDVAGAPGLVASLSGVPIPAYPAIVHSDSTTPDATFGPGAGYSLSSHSRPASTVAGGVLGGLPAAVPGAVPAGAAPAQAQALAQVTHVGNVVDARATSVASGISIPGLLTIGSVRTVAEMRSAGGAKPTASSSLTVTGLTIMGTQVELVAGRLVLAGQSVDLPITPLIAALHDQGVDFSYVAAHPVQNGVMSPALRVTTQRAVPTAATKGTFTVTSTFGGALATLSTSTFTEATAPATSLPSTDAGLPSSGAGGGGSLAPAPTGLTPGLPLLPDNAPLPEVAPTPSVATGKLIPAALIATRQAGVADWMAVFVALCIGGLLTVGGAVFVRIMGVRASWAS